MILKFADFQPNFAYFAYIIQKLIMFFLTKVLTELLRQKYKKIKKIEIPRPTHSQSSEMQISSVKLCKKKYSFKEFPGRRKDDYCNRFLQFMISSTSYLCLQYWLGVAELIRSAHFCFLALHSSQISKRFASIFIFS